MDQRAESTAEGSFAPRPRPLWANLYVQVLTAIALGVLVGHYYPAFGENLKPLGDGYIKLIKMLIAPIIFCTVVHGIASMQNMKQVGRVGMKALIYFEVVTTIALLIGMTIANTVKPGAGMNIDPTTIDVKSIEGYLGKAKEQSVVHFLLDVIPNTIVGAFATGEILQVLLIALLFAFGLQSLGEKGKQLISFIEQISLVMFRIVDFIMKLAPVGAFGAMAFTIGKYGVGTLASLAQLMACFYITCLAFIFLVLGTFARLAGFSIWRFIVYIREELLIVLGTSSSEAALPGLIEKMKKLGCDESVVGLVVPTGYSFNLDGTCIYLTMAALFLAQATNVDLTLAQELGIIGVLLLTSKGAAGVTGSGFIVLAATLSAVGTIPVASIAILLGIDRFMSEARALTNLIGNGVATVLLSRSEKALDKQKFETELAKA